jgi:uncharacterized protein (TIGR03089 family)
MHARLAQTVVEAFRAAIHADAARPLVTFYDDATGERAELSVATMANWVAKSANLLVDGHGLGEGDVAAVALPPHWQTAAVLLGCWSAGLMVDVDGASDSARAERASTGAAVGFVAEGRTVAADETYALSLAPLGQPFRPGPPAGTADYVLEVRAYGDTFSPRVRPEQAALVDGTTHAALVGAAAKRDLAEGARLLIDGDRIVDPIDWLVAPIVSGASIVLCRNVDASVLPTRLAAERATPL